MSRVNLSGEGIASEPRIAVWLTKGSWYLFGRALARQDLS